MSFGWYTAGTSNYGMANVYKPAGVINISYASTQQNAISANLPLNQTNGALITYPTVSTTSVLSGVVTINSLNQMTNNNYSSQHIDYEQNPSQ
jgi:hypothetical protein